MPLSERPSRLPSPLLSSTMWRAMPAGKAKSTTRKHERAQARRIPDVCVCACLYVCMPPSLFSPSFPQKNTRTQGRRSGDRLQTREIAAGTETESETEIEKESETETETSGEGPATSAAETAAGAHHATATATATAIGRGSVAGGETTAVAAVAASATSGAGAGVANGAGGVGVPRVRLVTARGQ